MGKAPLFNEILLVLLWMVTGRVSLDFVGPTALDQGTGARKSTLEYPLAA